MFDIPEPPAFDHLLLIENNPDYAMFVDDESIQPTIIRLTDGEERDVLQAWILVRYNEPYYREKSSKTDKEELVYINTYLTYFDIQKKESAAFVFWFFNQSGDAINHYMPNPKLSRDEFSPIKEETIGEVQFNAVRQVYEKKKDG